MFYYVQARILSKHRKTSFSSQIVFADKNKALAWVDSYCSRYPETACHFEYRVKSSSKLLDKFQACEVCL